MTEKSPTKNPPTESAAAAKPKETPPDATFRFGVPGAGWAQAKWFFKNEDPA